INIEKQKHRSKKRRAAILRSSPIGPSSIGDGTPSKFPESPAPGIMSIVPPAIDALPQDNNSGDDPDDRDHQIQGQLSREDEQISIDKGTIKTK
ncbi:MAG: hypothetical protein COW13_03225, partial [Candidatus Omnitrophica bacterium CG12_big_fil_rev_8_21_14_0_65_50_5]